MAMAGHPRTTRPGPFGVGLVVVTGCAGFQRALLSAPTLRVPAPALLDDAVPGVEDFAYLLDHQEVDICEAFARLFRCHT